MIASLEMKDNRVGVFKGLGEEEEAGEGRIDVTICLTNRWEKEEKEGPFNQKHSQLCRHLRFEGKEDP